MQLGHREVRLSRGAHHPSDDQVCVMEAVGIRWQLQQGCSLENAWAALTDRPSCTDIVIAEAAMVVNDQLSPEGLMRLEARADRLMSCHPPSDHQDVERVRIRVGCWAIRSVRHLLLDEDRAACDAWVEAAKVWLDNPTASTLIALLTAAEDTGITMPLSAPAAAAGIAASQQDEDLVLAWLDDLLDAWDEAIAAEGGSDPSAAAP